MKLLLFLVLFLAFHVSGTSSKVDMKVYKYTIRIDGRTYPTDSIWVEGKNTFWIGSDGINYGMKTTKL